MDEDKWFSRCRRVVGAVLLLIPILGIYTLFVPQYYPTVWYLEILGWAYVLAASLSIYAMVSDNRKLPFNLLSFILGAAFFIGSFGKPTISVSLFRAFAFFLLFWVLPVLGLLDSMVLVLYKKVQKNRKKKEAGHRQELEELMNAHGLTETQAEHLINKL